MFILAHPVMFSVGVNEETKENDDAIDEATQLDPVDS